VAEIEAVAPRGADPADRAGRHVRAHDRPLPRLPGLHRARGGPVSDSHIRNRVWYPAIAKAKIRKFPPRITRHTAASSLVQDGVPLFDVQVLLGHESFVTTTL
jgi:integrase